MRFLLSLQAIEIINGEVVECDNLLDEVPVGTDILQNLDITDPSVVVNSAIAPVSYCTVEISFAEACLCGHFARKNEIIVSVDKNLIRPIFSSVEVYGGVKIVQEVDSNHFLNLWRGCGYPLHIEDRSGENRTSAGKSEEDVYCEGTNCDSCLEVLENCPKSQKRNHDIVIQCSCHRCAEGVQQCLDGVDAVRIKKVTASIGDLYLPNIVKIESLSHGIHAVLKDGSVYTVSLEIDN